MYRVIIVEDEPEISRITKYFVEQNPEFEVKAIFSNGKEALNYIWLNQVDLVILDLFMPTMNGTEFLYRLRKENLQSEVIVVTAANDAHNIKEVLPYGVVDYLLKPFSAARLSEALDRCVQRHRIINAISGLDQASIDAVFSQPSQTDGASRKVQLEEKGLDEDHYASILDILSLEPDRAFSLEELAFKANLSKLAARRYLNQLLQEHAIFSFVDTGIDSKPVMRYRREDPAL